MLNEQDGDYQSRLTKEHATFANQVNLHDDLPESSHYWSNRHVLPKLKALGVPGISDLIIDSIREYARTKDEAVILSLGSGNGDQELGWLTKLAEDGVHNVRMRLVEFNPDMQRRAAESAEQLGFADRVELLVADFNTWKSDRHHDVIVGFQALHHVLDLEHLFAQIRASIEPDGVLVVHDMIGRNGHRRWPEAIEVIDRIWATLPPELRHNAVSGHVDEFYDDLDCATEGFEGIRAQDVLPVLLQHLHPGVFMAYGNVIDPFVERIYGGNFDMASDRDRAIIDHIGQLDDSLIDLGVVKPTRLTATFHPTPQPLRAHAGRTPEQVIRDTSVIDPADRVSFQPGVSDPHQLVRGPGAAIGRMNGVSGDRWAAPAVEFPMLVTDPAHGVTLSFYLPDWMPATGSLTIRLDGEQVAVVKAQPGLTEQSFLVKLQAGQRVQVTIDADWSVTPRDDGSGIDRRTLSYVFVGFTLREG